MGKGKQTSQRGMWQSRLKRATDGSARRGKERSSPGKPWPNLRIPEQTRGSQKHTKCQGLERHSDTGNERTSLVPSTSKRTWLPSGDSYPDELSSEFKGLIEIFSNMHGNKKFDPSFILMKPQEDVPHQSQWQLKAGHRVWKMRRLKQEIVGTPWKMPGGGLHGDSCAASSEDSQCRPEGDYGEGMFRGGDKGTWSFTWHDLLWRVFMQHAI